MLQAISLSEMLLIASAITTSVRPPARSKLMNARVLHP